jgi:flagella basal body P-ring formation protein FlgA
MSNVQPLGHESLELETCRRVHVEPLETERPPWAERFWIALRRAVYGISALVCFLSIFLPLQAQGMEKKEVPALANPGYQSIPEARFREVFTEYLFLHWGKGRSDVMVSRFKIVGNRPVPAGEIGLQLFQKDKRGLAGYVRLVALVRVNGVVENRVRLSGWVDVFDSVVCTGRNLRKGEVIKERDLYLERKNISQLSAHILTDVSKAVGLMVKHNVKAGTCLKGWMVEKSPIVDRGDMVTIVAESGDLKVTVPGRILERGYLGELIRVQNAMSKKEIYAKVVDNSTVLVEF